MIDWTNATKWCGVACDFHQHGFTQQCSGQCNLEGRLYVPLENPTPEEIEAIEQGGQCAGAYLDSIGKTDLATLTRDEWDGFIYNVCKGFCDGMRTIAGQVMLHFDLSGGIPRFTGEKY